MLHLITVKWLKRWIKIERWQIICSRLQMILSISEGCIDYQVQLRRHATKAWLRLWTAAVTCLVTRGQTHWLFKLIMGSTFPVSFLSSQQRISLLDQLVSLSNQSCNFYLFSNYCCLRILRMFLTSKKLDFQILFYRTSNYSRSNFSRSSRRAKHSWKQVAWCAHRVRWSWLRYDLRYPTGSMHACCTYNLVTSYVLLEAWKMPLPPCDTQPFTRLCRASMLFRLRGWPFSSTIEILLDRNSAFVSSLFFLRSCQISKFSSQHVRAEFFHCTKIVDA